MDDCCLLLLVVLHELEESELLNNLLSEVLGTFVCACLGELAILTMWAWALGPGPWLKIVSLSHTVTSLSSCVLCLVVCGYAL